MRYVGGGGRVVFALFPAWSFFVEQILKEHKRRSPPPLCLYMQQGKCVFNKHATAPHFKKWHLTDAFQSTISRLLHFILLHGGSQSLITCNTQAPLLFQEYCWLQLVKQRPDRFTAVLMGRGEPELWICDSPDVGFTSTVLAALGCKRTCQSPSKLTGLC